ncbi:MAG: gamma-glutamylcyclotransferase [Clostridia bacterium]|nr:gamma-glutamylcyclotransferase [Clostridia bacterium]
MKYYLAYGSNLNVEQMRFRCPTSKVVGTAVINGYELLFKGSKTGSYLTIEKCEGEYVPVGVWEVTERDEKNLDRYEGYPSFYYKTELEVVLKMPTGKRKRINAFVYIMHESHSLGLPTPYYVRTCVIGYDAFGFKQSHLMKAIEKSKGEVKNERTD